MKQVAVKGKVLNLNPTKIIATGGEAEVYDIGSGLALKLFKDPKHPDLLTTEDRKAASQRINIHQKKLPTFPKNLPGNVVTPIDLATQKTGKKIVGYTMKYLRDAKELFFYGTKDFREGKVSNEEVMEIFRNLHPTVSGLHKKSGVVIGDFNDLNVLVTTKKEAYLIDLDSSQFGSFLCQVFTEKFVDPLTCDSRAKSPTLAKPHNEDSDWYAFTVMLMNCLLYVGPYGGLYKPKDKKKQIPEGVRPLKRITVFDKEVRYPKPANHYGVLPDELLEYFHQTFLKDRRGVFPVKLLEETRWTTCTNCGKEHARNICPDCSAVSPLTVKVKSVRGNVIATHVFKTSGQIVFSAFQDGKLRWLYHEDGQFKREDTQPVISGNLSIGMRFRIKKAETLIAQNNQILTIGPKGVEKTTVDQYRNLPVFDSNENSKFWLENGKLLRDGQYGPEFVGNLLLNQTLFWVGKHFGFGFYRAGQLSVAFVFDQNGRGINDNVSLPKINGQLIDSTCEFAKDKCWFFISTQEGPKVINRCTVIGSDGQVEATAEAENSDGSWLGTLRGKCASANFLFAATDDGIMRLEIDHGRIIQTREFPDTEPFVSSGSHLYPAPKGIYVVGRREIRMLEIK